MSCVAKDHKVKTNFLNSDNIKWMLRLYSTSFRGVFRSYLNIYDGVFSKKPLIIFTKSSIADV